MEKTQLTPKTIIDGELTESTPTVEPNGFERTPLIGEDDRPHSSEPERVVEWGGPSNRYGKVSRKYSLHVAFIRDADERGTGKRSL